MIGVWIIVAQHPTLLLIGCGDIGSQLGLRCAAAGWRVVGLRRDVGQLPAAIEPLAADITDPATLAPLQSLAADYVVVTLTPAAMNEAGYQLMFRDGLNHVLAALDRSALKRLLFASSTSVYHQDGGEWVDEHSPLRPRRHSGRAILAAERALAAAELPHTVLRFGGIYGRDRSQLLQRVRAGRCAPQAPVHYSNRIHRDDCVNVLAHLIERDRAGAELADCYLAVDDAPAPIAEVHHWLAQQLGVPYRCEDKLTLLTGSKRCRNAALRGTGFRFQYPDYRSGYRALLQAAGEGLEPEPA